MDPRDNVERARALESASTGSSSSTTSSPMCALPLLSQGLSFLTSKAGIIIVCSSQGSGMTEGDDDLCSHEGPLLNAQYSWGLYSLAPAQIPGCTLLKSKFARLSLWQRKNPGRAPMTNEAHKVPGTESGRNKWLRLSLPSVSSEQLS